MLKMILKILILVIVCCVAFVSHYEYVSGKYPPVFKSIIYSVRGETYRQNAVECGNQLFHIEKQYNKNFKQAMDSFADSKSNSQGRLLVANQLLKDNVSAKMAFEKTKIPSALPKLQQQQLEYARDNYLTAIAYSDELATLMIKINTEVAITEEETNHMKELITNIKCAQSEARNAIEMATKEFED